MNRIVFHRERDTIGKKIYAKKNVEKRPRGVVCKEKDE